MSDMPPPPPPPPPPPGGLTPPPYTGGTGAPLGRVQFIGGLTKWVVGLVGASLVLQLISLVIQLSLRGSAVDLKDGTISLSSFEDKLGGFVALSVLASVAGLALLVVQIIWSVRIAKNLEAIGRQGQTFKMGLVIVANILGGCTLGILPFFMWREFWMGSDPESSPYDQNWKSRPNGSIVVAHLVATLVAVVGGLFLGAAGAISVIRQNSSNDVADNLSDRFGLVLLSGVLSLVVSVIFIQLVRQLAARHMKVIGEA
ncbi:MAG: DUF4328 domain-containing protein [Ilumatobacteraceae bacterium]